MFCCRPATDMLHDYFAIQTLFKQIDNSDPLIFHLKISYPDYRKDHTLTQEDKTALKTLHVKIKPGRQTFYCSRNESHHWINTSKLNLWFISGNSCSNFISSLVNSPKTNQLHIRHTLTNPTNLLSIPININFHDVTLHNQILFIFILHRYRCIFCYK